MPSGKRCTIEECHELAKARGGKCLSEQYLDTKTIMRWQCENGHIFSVPHSRIKRGHWCAECLGLKKHDDNYCHEIANKYGITCLSEKYINVVTHLKWKCLVGHIWFATCSSIVRTKGKCQECEKWNFFNQCCVKAFDHGGICLGNHYENAWHKIQFKCEYGHLFLKSYAKLNGDEWCPECANNHPYTIEYCNQVAQQRRGKCLTDKYKNKLIKMEWQCEFGHIWKMSFGTVLKGGWCTHCSKKVKHTIEDCQEYAHNHNGRCLSKEYKNAKTYLEWECEHGHTWKATFSDIVQGYWCPECVVWKTQKKLTEIVRQIFPKFRVMSDYHIFPWLKTKKGGKQQIDIFVKEIKLAIEYNGAQHYKPITFGGISEERARENLQISKKRDRCKYNKIRYHKKDVSVFVIFNYKEKKKLDYKYVLNKIKKSFIKNNIKYNFKTTCP